TCVHGLDDMNCPTCRIIKSTLPNNSINKLMSPKLNIENSFFKHNDRLTEKISREVTAKKFGANHPSINLIQKQTFINEIPNFKNNLFQERLNELDLSKEDNFGITKRPSLKSPEWQFEEEE
ncbi:MAG: hypothetical protein ACXACB_08010, partial [Promethearchaeota archaeon]